MLTEMHAGLIYVVQMAKRSITFNEMQRKTDRELQKTHCELRVARGAVLEAEHFF